ncbi:MAG TPA: MFS transporter, partial [bacterium]|nr:MFS transporter [bacterium]
MISSGVLSEGKAMHATKQAHAKSTFIVLWLAIFVAMLGVGIISPLLPTYANTLGASGFMLGLIFGGFSIARMFAMPTVGRLSDRHGRKQFIIAGLLIQVLAAIGFLFSSSPWQLVGVRAFQGLAGAMIIPVAQAYVGEISPDGKEATYMGWFVVAMFGGFGCGPLIGGIIEDYLSFSANFIFLAALCFISFLSVLCFLPEPKLTRSQSRSRMEVRYRVLLSNPIIRGLFFFRIANSFGRGIVTMLLPLFGELQLHLTTAQVGVVLSTNLLTSAAVQPIFGRLGDRINRSSLLIVGTFGQALSLAMMAFAHSFVQMMAINLLMGVAGAISMPPFLPSVVIIPPAAGMEMAPATPI